MQYVSKAAVSKKVHLKPSKHYECFNKSSETYIFHGVFNICITFQDIKDQSVLDSIFKIRLFDWEKRVRSVQFIVQMEKEIKNT
jgi:hypothetical protein